ncbi:MULTISPECIES: cysteine desulfurase family protein [unclassified Bosea (in: a-proteobacteria)]|uniref:cysteine desulfurase family protein n=1 Tax=unclassified Bosea (in: a-proteobacteria) TaxID=2653178 RepID=UPI000F74F452|nr:MULTISPECIES: cysteine desulfurase family protein [unclassified Bosea (in: a-proteobacteria)]AZO77124.1 cysteine desulfurase [Bosea sp. Tri-49]RXT21973.1 cysteine desulfurase [Bosea sp. Tri-39]RXT32313.1 cysteine desulfurase [Bosea sp. Tri-54]
MFATTRSYLDHNATTPVRPAVAEAMLRALQMPGNPSSVHGEGRAARGAIEQAREQVAALVGAKASNVVFTSGGTEANATILSPGLSDCSGARDCVRAPVTLLLHSASEHPCVRDGHRFRADKAEAIPVDGEGLVDLGWLGERLSRFAAERPDERALVSVHLANNETGVLQPIAEIVAIAKRHGALVHSDAVQAAGKIAIDINALGVDALTLSAHKIGGPKGVGAIVFRTGALELTDKPLRGGGQERGWRAGTENLPGIVGFGVAAEEAGRALATEATRLAGLRDQLEARLVALAPDTAIFGGKASRLPNTSAFATPGLKAETALIMLDLAGVALSSGSACSSGKVRRSHVLSAMGVDPVMSEGALRASLGWTTCETDIDQFIAAYAKALAANPNRRTQAAA